MHLSACDSARYRYRNLQKTATKPEHEEPDYFLKKASELDYRSKDYLQNLKDIWVEMTSVIRDLQFKQEDYYLRTSKKDWLPPMEPLQPKVGYEHVAELKTAPESVRRLFSIEYGSRSDQNAFVKRQLLDAVRADVLDDWLREYEHHDHHNTQQLLQQHPNKKRSIQARIALQTALIRNWTALKDHWATLTTKKPGRLNDMIKLALDHRRRLLGELRQVDRASFDRVCRKLRIAYHMPLLPEDVPENTRKKWVLNEIAKRVRVEKERALAELAEEYAKQRPAFEAFAKKRLSELDAEQQRLRDRLAELQAARGEFVGEVVGEYHQNTVDCVTENRYNVWHYMNVHSARSRFRQHDSQ